MFGSGEINRFLGEDILGDLSMSSPQELPKLFWPQHQFGKPSRRRLPQNPPTRAFNMQIGNVILLIHREHYPYIEQLYRISMFHTKDIQQPIM